jgi:hypothetical protein
MARNLRRHPRIQSPGTVRLSWQDASGSPKFARGKCLDLSASGIRVEIPAPIPPRTYVTVAAENFHLTANASVRHVARAAGKYLIGLEFSCPLKALADRLEQEQKTDPVHRS